MNSVMNIDVPKLQTNDVAFGYNSFYWVYTLQTSSSIERLSLRQILRDWKRLSRRDTGLLIISCRVFVMKMKSIYGLQMTHFRLGRFFPRRIIVQVKSDRSTLTISEKAVDEAVIVVIRERSDVQSFNDSAYGIGSYDSMDQETFKDELTRMKRKISVHQHLRVLWAEQVQPSFLAVFPLVQELLQHQ